MVPAQEPYHRDHALVVGVYRASKKKMLGTQQRGTRVSRSLLRAES